MNLHDVKPEPEVTTTDYADDGRFFHVDPAMFARWYGTNTGTITTGNARTYTTTTANPEHDRDTWRIRATNLVRPRRLEFTPVEGDWIGDVDLTEATERIAEQAVETFDNLVVQTFRVGTLGGEPR